MTALQSAALEYAQRGWPVFPLVPRGKIPAVPESEGGRGFKDAATDRRLIERWWSRWPQANIGFCPGRAGLLVIDQDGPEAARVAMSLGLFAEPVPSVISGRADGGRHLYFSHPGGTVGNLWLGHKQLEVRADAGYVILPPSIHPEGPLYTWEHADLPFVPLPPRALHALHQARVATPERRTRDIPKLNVIPEGERHTTLCSYAGRLARVGLDLEEGFRLLRGLNVLLCRPHYPENELWTLVSDIWASEGKKRQARRAGEAEGGTWPRLQSRRRWV